MSNHIDRKSIPDNADPRRTYQNREFVELPEDVADRDGAITHRIQTAGIRRKITADQVCAIRVVLSGTHEDMMQIVSNGQLDGWCDDSLRWLNI